MAKMFSDFIIGAVNTDATKRHVSINSPESLAEDLSNRFNRLNLSAMTLSEVSSLESVTLMRNFSNKDLNFDKTAGTRHGSTVQVWDSERFKLLDTSQAYAQGYLGQYLGIPLRLKETEEDYLHISVHLPNKNGRHDAYEKLKNYIHEQIESGQFKSIFVHGDFNMHAGEIHNKISNNLTTTVPLSVITTSGQRSIDNVAFNTNRACDVFYSVAETSHHYSHFPLSTSVSEGEIFTTIHANPELAANSRAVAMPAISNITTANNLRCVRVSEVYRLVHDETRAGVHHYINSNGNKMRFKSFDNGTSYPLKEILTNISKDKILK
jgi:hypothetical protein